MPTYSYEEPPDEPQVPGREGGYTYSEPTVTTKQDVARSAASALNTAVYSPIGQFGDYRDLMKAMGDWAFRKTGGTAEEKAQIEARRPSWLPPEPSSYLPSTADVKRTLGTDIYDYKAKTWPGAITGGVVGGIPATIMGGAASAREFLANLFRFGVAPGVTSTVAGKVAKEINPDFETPAEIAGQVLGQRGATKFISPNVIEHMEPQSRRAYANQVRQVEEEGIPVSAGARADDRSMRYKESEELPALKGRVDEAVTRAASRRVGNGRGGTYETGVFERDPTRGVNTLDTMLGELGNRFDTVSGRNVLHVDPQLGTDMLASQNHFTRTPGAYGDAAIAQMNRAQNHVRDLLQQNGPHPDTGLNFLTAEQYQRLRADYGRGARGSENPQVSEALHDFVHTIDEAMQRSLNRPVVGTPGVPRHETGGNPADAAVFPELRRDYRNALVVENAVKASNLAGARGHITPAALENAAATVMGRRAHERGYDDFAFAPAAKSVLHDMPDSGTKSRLGVDENVDKFTHFITDVPGFLLGYKYGGPYGAGSLEGLFGAHYGAAPLVKPIIKKAYNSYIASDLGQTHLGNQLMAEAPAGVRSLPGLLAIASRAGQPTEDYTYPPEGLLRR
jgi:hypothetical protein